MVTAVDTNILLDILIDDKKYFAMSKRLLDASLLKGALVICEAVYAELASQFDSKKELDGFLNETGIRLINSNSKSLYYASEAWKRYLMNRGESFICPKCGYQQEIKCGICNIRFSVKQHILTDFIVGGFAVEQADILLTRDRGYYKTYFKALKILGE